MASAAEAKKSEGNAFFGKGEFEKAIKLYSEAIELEPNNHVFYSNRSAAHCEAGSFERAEEDGIECQKLAQANGVDFVKGYYRIVSAQLKLGRDEDALKTVREGLQKHRNDGFLKKTQLEIRAKLDKIRKEKQNQKNPALTAMIGTPHSDERGVVVSTLADGDKKTYPQKGDYLSVHYTGVLRENGNEFDSSRRKKKPFKFTIGRGDVIRGWEEGLLQMSLGEKALLSISAEFGYGSTGVGGAIPPNAALVFEVELLNISSGK